MTIQEAHDLCSLAMLRPVVMTDVDQSSPFVVEVGINAGGGFCAFGRGEGETRDDAFLAAMTAYANLPYVRAASHPATS